MSFITTDTLHYLSHDQQLKSFGQCGTKITQIDSTHTPPLNFYPKRKSKDKSQEPTICPYQSRCSRTFKPPKSPT